jgi:acyl carrier protein
VSGTDEKLIRCFQATFDDLAIELVPTASADTVASWDSLNMIVLVSVIEEAFEVEIAPDDMPSLRSYAAMWDYLSDGR